MEYPTNSDDVIDSRQVIEAIAELTGELDDVDGVDPDEVVDMRETLAALVAFADEASGYAADWSYGETLIRDSYFEEYARDLADDIGAIDRNAGWPMSCIDWVLAAGELQQDYTSVSFDGVDYWVR